MQLLRLRLFTILQLTSCYRRVSWLVLQRQLLRKNLLPRLLTAILFD